MTNPFLALPWWGSLLFILGGGGMGAFVPSIVPEAYHLLAFLVCAGLVGVGLLSGIPKLVKLSPKRAAMLWFGLAVVFLAAAGSSGIMGLRTWRSASSATEPPPAPAERTFTPRTAHELLALYQGRTKIQGDQLIKPHKGLWVKAEGKVILLAPEDDGSIAVLDSQGAKIECRFNHSWDNTLARLNNGDPLNVQGEISQWQNGEQLALTKCEVIDDNKPAAIKSVLGGRIDAGQKVELRDLLFMFEFPGDAALGTELIDATPLVKGAYAWFITMQDLKKRVSYNVITIPENANAENAAMKVLGSVKQLRDGFTAPEDREYGDNRRIVGERLPYADKIVIYHEPALSEEQRKRIWEAYKAQGYLVEFRGPDYIADLWKKHGPRE